MVIFETFDIPEPTCKHEVSVEQRKKIAERVKKTTRILQKKMKRIDIMEAEAWKNSCHRG